jgi:hypothetical protein
VSVQAKVATQAIALPCLTHLVMILIEFIIGRPHFTASHIDAVYKQVFFRVTQSLNIGNLSLCYHKARPLEKNEECYSLSNDSYSMGSASPEAFQRVEDMENP